MKIYAISTSVVVSALMCKNAFRLCVGFEVNQTVGELQKKKRIIKKKHAALNGTGNGSTLRKVTEEILDLNVHLIFDRGLCISFTSGFVSSLISC